VSTRRREVENGHGQRRSREDYEELDRFLMEADGSLGDEDLRGANEALKKAGLKATSMWGKVGRPVLPGHVRAQVLLHVPEQEDLRKAERNSPELLQKNLRDLRSPFGLEVRREGTEKTAL
jgi:hypothetical protein